MVGEWLVSVFTKFLAVSILHYSSRSPRPSFLIWPSSSKVFINLSRMPLTKSLLFGVLYSLEISTYSSRVTLVGMVGKWRNSTNAIFMMMTTDSLHPPSGAVAITAVLGGDAVHRLGFHFILYPVLLNSILLLLIAVFFNRLIGRHYPITAHVNERSKDPTPTQKVSIQPKDIKHALAHHTELLDISQYDLEKIILEAQEHANERLNHSFVCQDIMSRDVIKLHEDDDIHQALEKFKEVNLMSLPVVNAEEKLVGTLALYEVVEWFKGAADPRNSWQHYVRQIMSRRVITVEPSQPIQDLVPYFVEKSFNYIPVVENQRLVGIVSRADMIAALQQLLNQQYVLT